MQLQKTCNLFKATVTIKQAKLSAWIL